jgi:uracil-DNA glycosylase family 4
MEDFIQLKTKILSCRDCKNRFGFIPRPILFGNENSKIDQISQAPSRNVHLTGKPFDDSTGKRLIKEWYKIDEKDFYNEDNFYITALSHCYPGKTKNGADRAPPIYCARKWLLREISTINNQIFVIIGQKAASFLFPNKTYEDLIFNNQYLNNKLTLVLPHPSPLNIKWFKEHPDFYEKRLIEIREEIKRVLYRNGK